MEKETTSETRPQEQGGTQENMQKTDKSETAKPSIFSRPWFRSIAGIVVIAIIFGGLLFWKSTEGKVSIDSSVISAPVIALSPEAPGTLDEVYVNEGDEVLANTPLARLGNEIITSQVSGIVVSVEKNIGKTYNPGEAVVSMIDPTELRVVGKLEEDKGLKDIKVGQPATFTVDAFGSEKFTGVVDEISPISNNSDVVFNISDKREENQFDVKVRFNQEEHPELKNGMSAKITVFVK